MPEAWHQAFGKEIVVFLGDEKTIGEKELEVWKRMGFEPELLIEF